jgi:hypothetical protein
LCTLNRLNGYKERIYYTINENNEFVFDNK